MAYLKPQNPIQKNSDYIYPLTTIDQVISSDDERLNNVITNLSNKVDTLISEYMLKIYPIGSIYISINDTNPTDLFGGIWEKIEGRFLLGSNTSYTVGATGGEATHKLSANEMPNHTHKVNGGDWIVSVTQSFATTGNLYYAASGNKSFQGGSLTTSGGGAAHNNMPPYLVVNIWKRTQ